jgi:hypothetical protein
MTCEGFAGIVETIEFPGIGIHWFLMRLLESDDDAA